MDGQVRESWITAMMRGSMSSSTSITTTTRDKRFIYPTAECQEQSINYITQIWTQVAEEFAAYDLHLIFEVVNEVRLSGTDDEWTPDTLNSQEAQRIINTYSQAASTRSARWTADITPRVSSCVQVTPGICIPTKTRCFRQTRAVIPTGSWCRRTPTPPTFSAWMCRRTAGACLTSRCRATCGKCSA